MISGQKQNTISKSYFKNNEQCSSWKRIENVKPYGMKDNNRSNIQRSFRDINLPLARDSNSRPTNFVFPSSGIMPLAADCILWSPQKASNWWPLTSRGPIHYSGRQQKLPATARSNLECVRPEEYSLHCYAQKPALPDPTKMELSWIGPRRILVYLTSCLSFRLCWKYFFSTFWVKEAKFLVWYFSFARRLKFILLF